LAQANPAPSPPVTTLPAQAKSDVGAPAPLPPGPTTPAPAKPVVVPVAPPKPVVVPAPAAPQVLVTTPPPSGRPAAPEVRTIELPPPPKPAPPAVVVAAPAAKAVAKAGDAAKSAAPLPTKVASKPAEKKPVEPTGWRVQLGAFGKRTQAEDAWTEVKTKQKAAVGNAKPIYESGASIVKLQIGPYKTRAEAKDACAKIAFSGRACFVTEAGS
jgi:hypothetical protein